MRGANLLCLLTALTTAGALRVFVGTTTVTASRDANVNLSCDIIGLNPDTPLEVLWTMRLENGSEMDVCEYKDKVMTVYRAGSYMDQTKVLNGSAALHIPGVQFSDEGEYKCRVLNSHNIEEGSVTLQVSAPPLADVTPADLSVEVGTEKTLMCNVYSFYPKEVSIRWGQYRKGSSDCEILEMWTCVKKLLENQDGTYNVTSLLTLNPKKEDNGNTYSCIVSHRSLSAGLSINLTLTVTERDDNSGVVIAAVIVTLAVITLVALVSFLYWRFAMKKPPTMSQIAGNNELIDMNRTTLTCQITDFRPNIIEISVCLRRFGEEEKTIYRKKFNGYLSPIRGIGNGGQAVVDVEMPLINGSAGPEERPLLLDLVPLITKTKFGSFSCQCSLHITPSYDLDNEAELSLNVYHPALKSAASKHTKLNVVGVHPKLLSIMGPERVIHEEQLNLTCAINGFKPRHLTITWLKRDRNKPETELLMWSSGNKTCHTDRYTHHVNQDEQDDKSYSFISAMTMKPTVKEDDGVTYICRTFHPATNHRAEKKLTMSMNAVPVLDPIMKERVSGSKDLKLSCKIHSFYPSDIKVTWYRDNVLLPSHLTEQLQDTACLYYLTSIAKYTPTLEDMKKTFRCEVQHVSLVNPKNVFWALEEFTSAPVLGDIQCVPAQPEPKKPVTLSSTINNMYPGDPVIQWYVGLTRCKKWETNLMEDPNSKLFSGTTELTITPTSNGERIYLEVFHSGKTFTKDYLVLLKGFPVLSEISSEPSTADYGKPVTLRCDVTGCNPEDISRVTWSERGEQKEVRGTRGVLSCYLTITPTAEDYGKRYTCSVTHKDINHPTEKKHLPLSAKLPALSEIVVHPAKVTANQKASFQVTISRFAPRDLQIKWYKEYSRFSQNEVTTSDLVIGSDSLYTCSSTLTFIPKASDDGGIIRCEVMHPETKAFREKRFMLNLSGDSHSTEGGKPQPGTEKTFHIKGITCETERPRLGEEVTLVGYIEGCQADSADFSWYKGMYPVDGEIDNKQDGNRCTSTITFTPEKSDTDCTIKLEVFYNYQTVEKSYTLQLV